MPFLIIFWLSLPFVRGGYVAWEWRKGDEPATVATYFVLELGPCTSQMLTSPGVVAPHVRLKGEPAWMVEGMVVMVKAFWAVAKANEAASAKRLDGERENCMIVVVGLLKEI